MLLRQLLLGVAQLFRGAVREWADCQIAVSVRAAAETGRSDAAEA
ncbi:hypothetical protein [Streptomyces sp. MNP-20]|nr:hypothetical protein [Streptomyces sp. MNP-20]